MSLEALGIWRVSARLPRNTSDYDTGLKKDMDETVQIESSWFKPFEGADTRRLSHLVLAVYAVPIYSSINSKEKVSFTQP